MTHYVLRLRGADESLIAEVHKSTNRWEYGWSQMLKYRPGFWIEVRRCSKDPCPLFLAWQEAKEAHEDDIEAERLRGVGL